MIPPIKNTLWQPSDWANHPLATKLDEYIAHELDFREGPDLSREAVGVELIEAGDIVLKSMIWDDLEAQCCRYVRQKWLDPRPPDIGFSAQFIEFLHSTALEELSKPSITLKDKPERINHLAALRLIVRIPQASAMENYLAAIDTEKSGSEFYYLLANAIVDCIDPEQHQKFHHQLFPLFWEMIEQAPNKEIERLAEQGILSIEIDQQGFPYFENIAIQGLFSLSIIESIPHLERCIKELAPTFSEQILSLMQNSLLQQDNLKIKEHLILFIPELIASMSEQNLLEFDPTPFQKVYDFYLQKETIIDFLSQTDKRQQYEEKILANIYNLAQEFDLQRLFEFCREKPEIVDVLYAKEQENNKYAKIILVEEVFKYAEAFDCPRLYDMVIRSFKHPNANMSFKQGVFSAMTLHAFTYFREVLQTYLESKYAQQKEMVKSVESILTKPDEVKELEMDIHSLERYLNKFEPTPQTDFNKGLPIV